MCFYILKFKDWSDESNEVQMRLEKAIQPRHHPFLIEKDDYKSVADRSILQMDNESTLRMKALYIVGKGSEADNQLMNMF